MYCRGKVIAEAGESEEIVYVDIGMVLKFLDKVTTG